MEYTEDDYKYQFQLLFEIYMFKDAMKVLAEGIVGKGTAIDADLQSLIFCFFKARIDPLRAMYKSYSPNPKQYENTRPKEPEKAEILDKYRAEWAKTIKDYCEEVINMCDDYFIPNAIDKASEVYFHRMKGDMYRYMSEAEEDGDSESIKLAEMCYQKAIEVSKENLSPVHPHPITVTLNYAVLVYEHLHDHGRAVEMLKEYSKIMNEYDDQVEDIYRDEVEKVRRTLNINLRSWETE